MVNLRVRTKGNRQILAKINYKMYLSAIYNAQASAIPSNIYFISEYSIIYLIVCEYYLMF